MGMVVVIVAMVVTAVASLARDRSELVQEIRSYWGRNASIWLFFLSEKSYDYT